MRGSTTLLAALAAAFGFGASAQAADWYRGNTHTHTKEGGGCGSAKTPFKDMVAAYKSKGYNFLVISDHSTFTKCAGKIDGDKFIGIDGQELSGKGVTGGKSGGGLAHVTSLNVSSRLPDGNYQAEVEAVNKAGGLPILAHPHYSLSKATAEDIIATKDVEHMEIQNTHINDGAGRPGGKAADGKKGGGNANGELLWQKVLDSGRVMYAVGADDAHGPGKAGKTWVSVFADQLTPDKIEEAMRGGRFYGSTGPKITSYSVDEKEMKVESDGLEIQFLGEGGKVLEKVAGKSGSYKFKGDEKYVRAIVMGSGSWAFCQPHFIGKSKGWSSK